MILLSLYCNYRKLYSLALGGNSWSITVETQNHSNKLLSSITAFFKHNWRWLHTLLFFNYLFETNFTLPLEALRLKVWSLNVGHSQPQLFSDLLVWFVGGCQHGSRSLAQESVEVFTIFAVQLLKYDWIINHWFTPINLLSTGDWSD